MILRLIKLVAILAPISLLSAPGEASATQDGESRDIIRLRDGGEIRGHIVKRNERTVWVDVGPTLVSFDLEQVAEIVGMGGYDLTATRGSVAWSLSGDLGLQQRSSEKWKDRKKKAYGICSHD